jgi:GTP-binding protein Era
MQEEQGSAVESATRAGHVALVGRPNVGKSTLLNALVGEKLSIVTPRAQTTRERVFGILSTDSRQAIFVDTPGLLEPKYALQRAMLETALAALAEADAVLLLLDAARPDQVPPPAPIELLRARRDVLVCAINKVDQATPGTIDELRHWCERELGTGALECSALCGEGVDALRERLLERLPASPFLYPLDDLAVQPVRFFVEELVRESVFELYEEEVPYATVVRIEEFRENRLPIYIRATLFVERASQKPIILGSQGAAIRELGRAARAKIEPFLGAAVFLDLWVKTLPGWRNKPSALKFLGYPVPGERAQP